MTKPPASEVHRSDLSIRECLQRLIGSGTLTNQVLAGLGNGFSDQDLGRILFRTMEEGTPIHGPDLTPSAQKRLMAAFELARRFRAETLPRAPIPPSPELPWKVLDRIPADLRLCPREWIGFVAIDRNGQPSDLCLVAQGSRTHVSFEPMEFFARLLPLRPQVFFLFHNHPSGNTEPSLPDHQLTARIAATARTLGTVLLGHWILTATTERWIDEKLSLQVLNGQSRTRAV